MPCGGFELKFGPDFPAFVVVVAGVVAVVVAGAGGWVDDMAEAAGAEEVDVVFLRADEVRAPQAHQPELHARDLALQLRHHRQTVPVQLLGRADGFRNDRLPRQDLVRVQLDLEHQGPPPEPRPREIFFQFFGDPAQFGAQFRAVAHVAEGAFGAHALALVLLRGRNLGAAEAEVALHEELECFVAEEFGEVGALGVEIAAGLDADGVEFALEDTADAIDFAGGEVAHEG